MRMWWPQWVQTSWLASQSRVNSICSHLGHFSQRFSGASLRATRARSFGRTKLVSQFMAALSHERRSGPSWRPPRGASAPEGAEWRYEVLRLLHFAELLARMVLVAELAGGIGLEVGDDGRLARRLVDGNRQDVLLAQPRH